ncbi:MAG: helix-hairpin-helix domain-containing protein [Methanobacteriota archaeon]
MDQGYLEWLLGVPSLGESKARALAERFPTFEHLRVATREELAAVPGLVPSDVDTVLRLVRPDEAEGGGLFLCSECGSFAGSGAKTCPVCGAAFGESEDVAAGPPAESVPAPPGPPAPDRAYVEWLDGLPGLGPQKARSILERFPTFEHLRAATRDEVAAIDGLAPEDLDALGTLLGQTAGKDASGRPFLCPECGSFTGSSRTECSVCGAELSETSLAGAFAAPPSEGSPDRLPLLCLHCGAFMSPKQARCGMCGRERTPGEIALIPGVDAPEEASLPFCAHCGAYLYAESEECIICGRTVADVTAPAANGQPKGVGRGFLTRWRRITEEGATSGEERLREQLEHYDRLLEADPTLERAWVRRARILTDLGLPRAAAESLARAAELNPSKDDEYRLEVLDLLKSDADVAFLPPRWRAPAATQSPPSGEERLVESLRHYDALLEADPSLAMAWRTRSEILQRLGRGDEAEESLDQARDLEALDDLLQRESLEGLQTAGPVRPAAAARTTGRVNGRINGLTNGRVNGLTNGAVNGLTLGRGATNGLVNGDGFTNGRRGRYGPARLPRQPHWARSVVGVAAVVALMVLVPLLASLISPGPGPLEVIRIDRDFGDWSTTPAYVDSAIDQVANPDINLLSTKLVTTEDSVYVYARVQGRFFQGAGTEGADSLFVFVDEDGDPATGYPIGDLGADGLAEVFGWDGAIRGVVRRTFNATGASHDWNLFRPDGSAAADALGGEVELRMSVDRGTRDARVLVYAADNRGNRDPADGALRPNAAAFYVEQLTVAPDTIGATPAAILRVALVPFGGVPSVVALNVTQDGTSADPVSLALYADDGSGTLDAADARLATSPLVSGRATLPVARSLVGPLVLWVEATWTGMTPAATFGVRVSDVWTNASMTVRAPQTHLVYLASAPANLTIDGAFGDWSGRPYGRDLLGDVVDRTAGPAYNANVDLLATAVEVGANFTAYARVDGRILGGEDIPTARARTADSIPSDSDLDGVPDAVESSLANPELAFDFDNDNVTDNRTGGDVDADGVVDHPDGPDVWLNTTIPAWYPPPYAGRTVTRFIGPIAPAVQEGLDVVYAYVDADNRSDTGLQTVIGGDAYGFEFAFAVLGRNGQIRASGLFAYTPGGDPWAFSRPVDAALDAHRVEFAVDAAALGLSPGYRVRFYASDWRLGYDEADPGVSSAIFPVAARAATTVVINEVSPAPNPEWIELANPTSSAVSLAGWDLVRVSGNRIVVLFTFTIQVLGVWGSGTEYVVVTLPNNSLPNGNVRVRLRQSGALVDQTTYSAAVAGGQSWSRLKDPLTGIPLDTDSDAADFYISLAPSRGQGNDRHRPTISVAKTASASVASPGDTITYTVYYNNTDTGLSRTVWVNDTLPAGVAFVGSSVAPATVAGATYGWVFTNVLPSSANSFMISAMVNASGPDGSVQANAVTLDYTDQLQRRLPRSQAWANVTVVRPMIQIAKTASPSAAQVGQTVTFTIYYNNTGSVAAGTVSIRDVLPVGLNYTGSSPAPTWTDGRTIFWNFTNVAPGPHSITLTTVVTAGANVTSLVNWAFLNYTTLGGFPLASGSASSIIAIPEFQDIAFVLAVPLLALGLSRHLCTRRRKGSG